MTHSNKIQMTCEKCVELDSSAADWVVDMNEVIGNYSYEREGR